MNIVDTDGMTRYFLDTEFIEDGTKLDLISIGLVCEDGREYYAISTQFDKSKANDWVKENVLAHLPPEPEIVVERDDILGLKWVDMTPEQAPYRTRKQIADDILAFVGDTKPAFYGYYADYDWVALCRLYGAMIALPKGWPMYCRDIKQTADELGNPKLPAQKSTEHHALDDARWNKVAWEFLQTLRRL